MEFLNTPSCLCILSTLSFYDVGLSSHRNKRFFCVCFSAPLPPFFYL
jgi:hypothetical protein